jgi:hypothetical protein
MCFVFIYRMTPTGADGNAFPAGYAPFLMEHEFFFSTHHFRIVTPQAGERA